jgi:hypothetical protein
MACDLTLLFLTGHAPTSAGGFGYISYETTTAADDHVWLSVDGPVYAETNTLRQGPNELHRLPAGLYSYRLYLENTPTCEVTGTLRIPEPASPVDPSLADAPRWEPVGGVLPNPVLLKVEASLLSAGAPRLGLHVEVELWRPAAVAAFVTFRATIREATQYIDAAPYLRAELRALQRYAAAAPAPLVDADASLRFSYRYRVVDKAGAEPWVKREGPRYAVLAALAGPTDTMSPYVADGTGKVASVFPDFEGMQFVGYPLEASVLLPPPSGPRWAELRYLDGWGNAVEIRSYALAADLPAGLLRIPLPNDPPVRASVVEVSVRDDNRAFVGSGGNVVPTPPPSTSGLYSDSLYGMY